MIGATAIGPAPRPRRGPPLIPGPNDPAVAAPPLDGHIHAPRRGWAQLRSRRGDRNDLRLADRPQPLVLIFEALNSWGVALAVWFAIDFLGTLHVSGWRGGHVTG
jgi:hypothetical protein